MLRVPGYTTVQYNTIPILIGHGSRPGSPRDTAVGIKSTAGPMPRSANWHRRPGRSRPACACGGTLRAAPCGVFLDYPFWAAETRIFGYQPGAAPSAKGLATNAQCRSGRVWFRLSVHCAWRNLFPGQPDQLDGGCTANPVAVSRLSEPGAQSAVLCRQGSESSWTPGTRV